jgi:hypothetical protein
LSIGIFRQADAIRESEESFPATVAGFQGKDEESANFGEHPNFISI